MLNMDFNQRIVINTRQQAWLASPHKGIWRKPLAREEAEAGHATSIARFEAGASCAAHGHPLGEEILVLEGMFSDKNGDFPAGSYIRNPEGFTHAPIVTMDVFYWSNHISFKAKIIRKLISIRTTRSG